MKTLRKTIAILIGLLLVAEASGPALAAQVKSLKVTLSDTRPTQPVTHTWSFNHATSATLKSITFEYCTDPSGSCAKPANLVTTAATKGTVSGLLTANWTLNRATDGKPRLIDTTGNGEGVNADQPISIGLDSVRSPGIQDCHPAPYDGAPNGGVNSSSGTCYVHLYTYTSADGLSGETDVGIASYTVVSSVTVSARVDPTFTFVVSAVAQGASYGGATTSVGTTYNTIPFGNLTAGTPKYASHMLNVTTNTENGYTVSLKMHSAMTGVYTNNNIDPFAAPGAAYNSPVDWMEPNGGTPNDNTGWIGFHTTDGDLVGWNGGHENRWGKFGPVESANERDVMKGAKSDNGTGGIYITYAIEANVFQPSDTYTGTIVYNALPTY